jgi:hypothetical protein
MFSPIIGFIIGYCFTSKWDQLFPDTKIFVAIVSLFYALVLSLLFTRIFIAIVKSDWLFFLEPSRLLSGVVFGFMILFGWFLFILPLLLVLSYYNHKWVARVYAEEKMMGYNTTK